MSKLKIQFHENLTLDQWFADWFGYYKGREIGTPQRFFTSNPNVLAEKVKYCAVNKLPCFLSVQPYSRKDTPCAIEKLFFDFDYAHKNEKITEKEAEQRKKELKEEVKQFVKMLSFEGRRIKPLIVKTRRGYHVYVFLDQTYEFSPRDLDFARSVYRRLCMTFLDRINSKYCDMQVIGNIKQLARVPLSVHEKTGEVCIIVDENLKPTKVRRVDFYRKIYGLRKDEVMRVVKQEILRRKFVAEKKRELEKFKGKAGVKYVRKGFIRPCFQHALKVGEMSHQQRLALFLEAYCAGITEEEDLVNIYRPLHDFDEKITRYQVKWLLEHLPKEPKPYQCKTIYKYGWCLKSQCPIYKKLFKKL